MTTGEKLALFRKKKGITQEELAEILQVSRQSVSRWEKDVAFPETDKLIKLSKMFECSIDFLLSDNSCEEDTKLCASIDDCCKFIHDCGHFFLATSVDNKPRLRPFGMIHSIGGRIFIVTDKRKKVYCELVSNSQMEIASYNLHTQKWIRISGKAEVESSVFVKEDIMNAYPALRQKYQQETEMFLAIFKLVIDDISIN